MKTPRRPRSLGRVAALAAAGALVSLALATASCRKEPPLPTLAEAPAFALTNQDSASVTKESLLGTPWVASFFFTRCPTVCPKLTQRMAKVAAVAEREEVPLRLVSFTVDPEHDRPEVLRAFAERFGAAAPSWSFLTGTEADVDQLAKGFLVGLSGKADPSAPDFGILHSGHLLLVDANGQLRAVYGSDEEGVEERVVRDARGLGVR